MRLTRITRDSYDCQIPAMLVIPLLPTDSKWCCSELLAPHSCKFHLTQNVSATSEDLLHNLYVDNLVSGCKSEEAAIQYFTESRSVLSSAGFNLCSWSSNSPLLQTTALQHKVAETTNPVKVLGLIWNTQTDSIHLFPCTSSGNSPVVTKRKILRWSSTVFDPLGLISPVTISAKLFLQQLWQEHIS